MFSKKSIEEVWDREKEKNKPEVVVIPPRKVVRKEVPESEREVDYGRRPPKSGPRK
jgi:hypothetical protein